MSNAISNSTSDLELSYSSETLYNDICFKLNDTLPSASPALPSASPALPSASPALPSASPFSPVSCKFSYDLDNSISLELLEIEKTINELNSLSHWDFVKNRPKVRSESCDNSIYSYDNDIKSSISYTSGSSISNTTLDLIENLKVLAKDHAITISNQETVEQNEVVTVSAARLEQLLYIEKMVLKILN